MLIENINLPLFGEISIFNKKIPPANKIAHVFSSTMIDEIHIARIFKVIKWYKARWNMPWDVIVLNDGLNEAVTQSLIAATDCTVVAFHQHLGRFHRLATNSSDYPYEWRNLSYLGYVLADYDKVIFMANDLYVLKQEMMNYLNGPTEGWIAFWFEFGRHPETACQILNKGCSQYSEFVANDINLGNVEFMDMPIMMYENYVPFTHIEKKFKGDRFTGTQKFFADMDYLAQAQPNHNF